MKTRLATAAGKLALILRNIARFEHPARVEIDGACASACTMLAGIIPQNRICVTPRASLVFHSAWDAQADQAVAADGNRILWSTYDSVRRWIKRHGGLHSQTITLSGPELAATFPACR